MRLGVLETGAVSWTLETMLEPLRARDIDIVTGDSIIGTVDDGLREAKRLARADCDGVLLLVGEGVRTEAVSAAATLLAGVPLLLAGYHGTSAFFDSAGTLEAIGARFDRVYFGNAELAAVYWETWLQENAKKHRHRGVEAARKLYGQRLYVPQDAGSLPDAALWIHQFGIITTSDTEGADFAASGGDTCGALTEQLLSLVAGKPASNLVSIAASHGSSREEGDTEVTLARITRTRGRFRCLLLRGALREVGVSAARFDCSEAALFAAAASPWLHTVPGDHIGAMRAACAALDIDTLLLHPITSSGAVSGQEAVRQT